MGLFGGFEFSNKDRMQLGARAWSKRPRERPNLEFWYSPGMVGRTQGVCGFTMPLVLRLTFGSSLSFSVPEIHINFIGINEGSESQIILT